MRKLSKMLGVLALASTSVLVFTNSADAKTITVKKGDTLWSLARNNNTSVEKIIKDNNIKNGRIRVGDKLEIGEAASAPKTSEKQSDKITGVYVVKKGDTVYAIARRHGITRDQLLKNNGLRSNHLKIGQVLDVRNTDKTTAETGPKNTNTDMDKVGATKTNTSNNVTDKDGKKIITKSSVSKKNTTNKTVMVGGAKFKDAADQALWNKVANNYRTDRSVAGLQPRVAMLKQFLGAKFGINSFSLYRPGDFDGTGHGHGNGLAIDLMVPVGAPIGDQIAQYLADNYHDLGIYYIIWEQKYYMHLNNIYGPAYRWNMMPDRGSITQNHYDHVHISFNP